MFFATLVTQLQLIISLLPETFQRLPQLLNSLMERVSRLQILIHMVQEEETMRSWLVVLLPMLDLLTSLLKSQALRLSMFLPEKFLRFSTHQRNIFKATNKQLFWLVKSTALDLQEIGLQKDPTFSELRLLLPKATSVFTEAT